MMQGTNAAKAGDEGRHPGAVESPSQKLPPEELQRISRWNGDGQIRGASITLGEPERAKHEDNVREEQRRQTEEISGSPMHVREEGRYSAGHREPRGRFRCLFSSCPYTSARESNCMRHMEEAHGWTSEPAELDDKTSTPVWRPESAVEAGVPDWHAFNRLSFWWDSTLEVANVEGEPTIPDEYWSVLSEPKCNAEMSQAYRRALLGIPDLDDAALPTHPPGYRPPTDSGYASLARVPQLQVQEGFQDDVLADVGDSAAVYSAENSDLDDGMGMYTSQFAKALADLVYSETRLSDRADLVQAIERSLPKLLRAFSLRLGCPGSSMAERKVMYFVFKHSRYVWFHGDPSAH